MIGACHAVGDYVAYDVHGLLMTATPVDTHIHGDTHTDRQTDS